MITVFVTVMVQVAIYSFPAVTIPVAINYVLQLHTNGFTFADLSSYVIALSLLATRSSDFMMATKILRPLQSFLDAPSYVNISRTVFKAGEFYAWVIGGLLLNRTGPIIFFSADSYDYKISL